MLEVTTVGGDIFGTVNTVDEEFMDRVTKPLSEFTLVAAAASLLLLTPTRG